MLDLLSFYNPIIDDFFNILSDPSSLFKLDTLIRILVYYIAPFFVIYYFIKEFLEDTGLLKNHGSEVAFFISLVSLPYASLFVIRIVSVFTTFSIVFLMGAIFLLGMGRYYKRRLHEYNFVLNSEPLTFALAHLPLITSLTLVGGIIGRFFFPQQFVENILLPNLSLILIIPLVITGIYIYNLYIHKKLDMSSFLIGVSPLYPLLFGMILSFFSDLSTLIGSVIGMYISFFIIYVNRKSILQERLEGIKDIQKHLLEEINNIQVTIDVIDKLISNRVKDIRNQEWKTAEKFGIKRSVNYSKDTLLELKKELREKLEILKTKLEGLYDYIVDSDDL